MKIVILQNVRYRHPEGAMSQYHGGVWAEEFRRRGHDATKMVVGDPAHVRPISPLLSVSTMEQRRDPSFWGALGADVVICYCGPDDESVGVVRAIKTGSPKTRVVARIEGNISPRIHRIRNFIHSFPQRYVAARHCPTESFRYEKRNVFAAVARSFAATARELLCDKSRRFVALSEWSDATTFFFDRLVDDAKAYFQAVGRSDLAVKILRSGYPVRSEFRPMAGGGKIAESVVSVANWRHCKDPDLTADAMIVVMRNVPNATYTIIGQRSDRVASRILSAFPEAASRVRVHEHVDNWKIPEFIATAQVFLLCSYKEGVPSVLSEALCCGCSLALAPSPATGAFADYVSSGDGSISPSRDFRDVASTILAEFDLWRNGRRNVDDICNHWNHTRVSSLCDDLLGFLDA